MSTRKMIVGAAAAVFGTGRGRATRECAFARNHPASNSACAFVRAAERDSGVQAWLEQQCRTYTQALVP